MNKKVKLKLCLVAFLLLTLPVTAVHAGHQGPFNNDPGDGGDGGAGGSCSVPCPDGSISGIACLPGQQAHCTCSGSPVRVNPFCS